MLFRDLAKFMYAKPPTRKKGVFVVKIQAYAQPISSYLVLFRWIIPVVLVGIMNRSVCTSSTTNS